MPKENDGYIDETLRRWAGYLNGLAILFTLGWGLQATWKAPSIIGKYLDVRKEGNHYETKFWEWRASSICFGIYAYWIFILTFFSEDFNIYWPTISGAVFGFKYGQHEHGLSVWIDALVCSLLAVGMRKAADHFGAYELDGSFRRAEVYQLEGELAQIEKERAEVDVNDVEYAEKMAEFDRRAERMKYLYSK